jgi:hypothetical protein
VGYILNLFSTFLKKNFRETAARREGATTLPRNAMKRPQTQVFAFFYSARATAAQQGHSMTRNTTAHKRRIIAYGATKQVHRANQKAKTKNKNQKEV